MDLNPAFWRGISAGPWFDQVSAPVLLFQFQFTQALEVLLQSMADQRAAFRLLTRLRH